jgi:hypothetical protein
MFGGLLRIPEEELDRAVERVLSNKRVDMIARKVTEMLLAQLVAGLQDLDKEADRGFSPQRPAANPRKR